MIAKMFEEEVKNMLKEPYERQHAKKREGFAFGAVQCSVTHRRHFVFVLFCFVCLCARFNPKWRFNMDKNRIAHPLQYEKRKARNKLNYINPLFYIRRIKNNLMSVGHRNHI